MAAMSIEAKAARAAYYREYRKKYPERIKEAQARYWEKKATEGINNGGTGDDQPDGSKGTV